MSSTRRVLPPAIGRADLVRAGLDREGADRAQATWFGFDYRAQVARQSNMAAETRKEERHRFERAKLDETPAIENEDMPIVCTRLTTREDKSATTADPPQTRSSLAWGNRPDRPPRFYPLASGRYTQQLIDGVINTTQIRGKPNIPKVIRRIAAGQPLTGVPRREAVFRSERLQVIIDRSTRLTPLFDDQSLLLSQIHRLFPQLDVMVWVLQEATGRLRPVSPDCPAWPSPEFGPLLVLGDLGLLGDPTLVRAWRDLAREFVFNDGTAHAVLPLSDAGPGRNLIGPWQTHPWETGTPDAEEGGRVDRLLALASPAIRLEPGLLRGLRRHVLPEATIADEIAVWRHPALTSKSADAASFDPDARNAYTRRLVGLATHDPDAVANGLATIRDWRHSGADEIWFEEILGLPAALREDDRFVDPSDLEAADAFFANMHGMAAKEDLPSGHEAWLSRIGHRHKTSRDGIWQHPHAAAALVSVLEKDPNFVPPVLVDTKPNAADWHAKVTLDTNGNYWMSNGELTGQHLGTLTMRDTEVEVVDPITDERLSVNKVRKTSEQVFLGEVEAPFVLQSSRSRMEFSALDLSALTWADEVTVDNFGPRADLVVADARLRFRWVPPGYGIVGPGPQESLNRTLQRRDELTFATGFWLMERPLTIGDLAGIPGCRFMFPENIRTDDPEVMLMPAAQTSLPEFEAAFDTIRDYNWDARLRLPTPLEWEYACRAGSLETTTYNGTPEPEDVLDHTLSDIAWFRPSQAMQNSSERLMGELTMPRPVMQKSPNAWGFHDMLGNVAEWCEGDTSDPDTTVVKGGSYMHQVADVRAAYAERIEITRRETWIGLRPAIGKAEIEMLRMLPRPTSIHDKLIRRNRPPRVQISYETENYGTTNQVELPFVIGVLADLSGEGRGQEALPVPERQFRQIDSSIFDELMAQMAPRAVGRISVDPPKMPGKLFSEAEDSLAFDLTFESLDDFSLESIARTHPSLRSTYATHKTLAEVIDYYYEEPRFPDTAEGVLNDAELKVRLMHNMTDYQLLELEGKVPSWRLDPDGDYRELEILGQMELPAKTKAEAIYLATLAMVHAQDAPDIKNRFYAHERTANLARNHEAVLSYYTTAILYSEPVQKLESAWRGLHYLVNNTETDQTLKIRVLDISKSELADISQDYDGPEFDQSPLFKKIYEDEYGQFGGEPFGVLIGDYEFDHRPTDIQTLRFMGELAESALAPFIAAPAPSLMELNDWRGIEEAREFDFMNSSANYAAWNGLRESEAAGYIALAMPRLLARPQFGSESRSTDWQLRESAIHGERPLPWMSAAYAMATNIARSFKENGWVTRIRGVESGGAVNGLTVATAGGVRGNTELLGPVDVAISDRREWELSKLGMMPLMHRNNTDSAFFIGAQSLRKPPSFVDPEQTAAANFQTRLPYLFPALRFAQYLKVVARDKIGNWFDRRELQTYLQDWINQYVDANPTESSDQMKARHPLAGAEVQIDQAQDPSGEYEAKLFLRPHYQTEGMETSLRIIMKIPGISR